MTSRFQVEAGLMDMLTRMQTGRFKVFKHLNDWWEEFRLYHRKDGKVVKEDDDLMAATRYAMMMLALCIHQSCIRQLQTQNRISKGRHHMKIHRVIVTIYPPREDGYPGQWKRDTICVRTTL